MRAALTASLFAATTATHYEDPKGGCQSGEIDVQVQGVAGAFCSPPCGLSTTCPTDVPTGVTAKPQCALEDGKTHKKYCALICTPGADDAQCGTNASCKSVQSVGLCTYDDDSHSNSATETFFHEEHPPNYLMLFEQWKSQFNKAYNGDEPKRFAIFKDNVNIVYETNLQDLSYKLELNQFADLTAKEFAEQYTGLKKPEKLWGDLPYLGRHNYSGNALADAVDWTTKGAVTPVKNQGQCGSCWSFSATGSMEGAWEIATGKLVSLSEQQFVDCDKVDQGCSGGLMDNAFKYAEANALCTEDSYSYKARKGTCATSSCTVGIPKGGVVGYKDVATDDKEALMEAVVKGPVSIAIEADLPTFQMYKSGILGSICGSKLDHGVLVVGYGTDGGKDYWKVKNSWGPTWGDQGYIRLLRGKAGAGECGLLSGPPSYPIVKGKQNEVVV